MKILRIYFLLLPLIFSSCTTEIGAECVYPGSFDIGFGQEYQFSGLRPVYASGDFTVWISSYISPNNDGIRDTFVVFIEDHFYQSKFISYPYDVIDPIGNATTDPYNFLYDGSLAIYDNCGDLFVTNNTGGLYWRPQSLRDFIPGVYYADLQLTLADGSVVNISESFEVIDPY